MVSLILIPLAVLMIIIGLILMVIGSFQNIKILKKVLYVSGGLIMLAPVFTFFLVSVAVSNQYVQYVGSYKGNTSEGALVYLELTEDKEFVLRMNQCNIEETGSWDSVLMDEYILELKPKGKGLTIQASIFENEITFYNSSSLACMTKEKLKFKRDQDPTD